MPLACFDAIDQYISKQTKTVPLVCFGLYSGDLPRFVRGKKADLIQLKIH